MAPPPAAHGTRARYSGGCRCPECTQANRDYLHRWRHNIDQPTQTYQTYQPWRHRAACAGMSPDVFYPARPGGRGGRAARDALDRAIAVCRRCPVTTECLNYALDRREEHGVWGATSPEDRQALHRIRTRRRANA